MLICEWAVNAGNIFVWVFSLSMWHLMSRSISVDGLAFHNIKCGTSDSIKFKFDETKADKTGEFVQEKNCYANPLNGYLCYFLALACWISLNAERLEATEHLFIIAGSQFGSASQRYCTQLAELVAKHFETAKHHLRVSHFNAHGIRKGSGTHASSATTAPPSFVAVAACGEWSIGKILDVYFKFAMAGDQYLGRLLALLNPEKPDFAILPPHWKDPTHPSIQKGIKVAFRNVLLEHGQSSHDPTGLLSLLLASMVHHSEWMLKICAQYPDHPFHSIALLSDSELLAELKNEHLTMEPNSHVPSATGVPPHVVHTRALNDVHAVCIETRDNVSQFNSTLRNAISEAVDAKVAAEGGVNQSILQTSLKQLKDEIFDRLSSISFKEPVPDEQNGPNEFPDSIDPNVRLAGPFEFFYKSTNWCIPESFQFPAGITRLNGWRLWLKGTVIVEGSKQWRIKPYRKLAGHNFHSKQLKDEYKLNWKPIFTKMAEAPGLSIPSSLEQIDNDFIESSYKIATDYLKSCFSYIFKSSDEGLVNSYTVGTWSYKIKYSVVKKCGTPEDIAMLPDPTRHNRRHKEKRTFTRGPSRKPNKIAKKGTSKRSSLPQT